MTQSTMVPIALCLAVVIFNENNNKVQAQLLCASAGFENALKFWYPEDAEFNESCVSEGCPALTNYGLCHKEMNITVLHSVLKTAAGCMREPICGLVIDNRLTPKIHTTTEGWLPGMETDGFFATLPDTGYLSNVSNIQFEFLFNRNKTHRLPIYITFISNMRASGNFKMKLIFRNILPTFIGQALDVTVDEAKYDLELEYVSTIVINESLIDHNYDLKLVNSIIKSQPMLCGIDMPEGLPNILTLLTTMTQMITEKSSWAARKAAFLEKYFQSAIRTVSNNC